MDYCELEVNPLFENHLFQFKKHCTLWRMNLLAVSDRDKNIMFIAKTDIIYVYRLGLLDYKPGVPIKELKCPMDENLKSRIINAIKVGNIGNEEVLVSVDDLGDVFVWFTANLDKNPIQFNNEVSTWGIALHGPKRLLAVSANSHSITIFNLQKSVQFFNELDDDDVDDLNSSDEEESRTQKSYSSDDDALGGQAKSVLRGHENNIPNICFSACGRFLVSCSIDNTCRLWNVKSGELMQTKVLVRHGGGFNEDWYEMNEDWGWTVNFVSKSAFKNISPNGEVFRRLTSNPESSQQVRSTNNMNRGFGYDLDDDQIHIDHNSDDMRRLVVRRLRITEYEDGYMEDRSEITGVESDDDDVEEYSNENDYTEGETDSDGEEQPVIDRHDGDRASDIEEGTISVAYPIQREPHLEVEGNSTPAYYDRAESSTPVVENYTENNPDYRWSVGHELNILSNEQSDENGPSLISEGETKNGHDGERSEGLSEEDTVRSPIQGILSTSAYSPVQPSYSPVSSPQNATSAPSHMTPNLSSETSVSPTYSPISSTEYNSANRESSIIATIINDLQRGSPSPSPDNHEIESNSQSSRVPTNENVASSSDSHSVPLNHDSPSMVAMDIPDVYDARLQLSDELVLYTSKHDMFILDPKSHLNILRTENDVVCKVDTRRFLSYGDYDRLNMIEVIPELSLTIVASQQGKIALTRLIKIIDDNGYENYYLYPELYLPLLSTTSMSSMNGPLLGMFVAKHDTLQDPALFCYRLYLLYWSGTMLCYEIRRKQETNPLRMDNILI